jgi:hypothetical protein
VRVLVSWAAFWWLWLLFAGEWNRYEWIAAAGAATVATGLTELARARTGVRASVPLRLLSEVWSAIGMVFVDFAVVMWALVRGLVRREAPRGTMRRRASPATGSDASAVGLRAWVTILADFSPNAYVVDMDGDHVLMHDLVPLRKSEEPV